MKRIVAYGVDYAVDLAPGAANNEAFQLIHNNKPFLIRNVLWKYHINYPTFAPLPLYQNQNQAYSLEIHTILANSRCFHSFQNFTTPANITGDGVIWYLGEPGQRTFNDFYVQNACNVVVYSENFDPLVTFTHLWNLVIEVEPLE